METALFQDREPPCIQVLEEEGAADNILESLAIEHLEEGSFTSRQREWLTRVDCAGLGNHVEVRVIVEVDLLRFVALQEVSTAKATEVVVELVIGELMIIGCNFVIFENEAKYSILLLFYVQIRRKREYAKNVIVDFFHRVCVIVVLVQTQVAIVP